MNNKYLEKIAVDHRVSDVLASHGDTLHGIENNAYIEAYDKHHTKGYAGDYRKAFDATFAKKKTAIDNSTIHHANKILAIADSSHKVSDLKEADDILKGAKSATELETNKKGINSILASTVSGVGSGVLTHRYLKSKKVPSVLSGIAGVGLGAASANAIGNLMGKGVASEQRKIEARHDEKVNKYLSNLKAKYQ